MHAFNVFDFLRDIVSKVPDLGGSEGEDRPATKRRLGPNKSTPHILCLNSGIGFMS